MLIAGPTIARLVLRNRRWAHRRVIAGDFGAVVARRGRAQLVDLTAVESRLGVTFSSEALAAVGIHREETNGAARP
jgi:hypothetical protein